MRAGGNFLLKGAVPRLAHQDFVRLGVRAWLGWRRHFEITFSPSGDDMRDISGIARPPQQMIGVGERNEAFRMFCRRENAAGIVDADCLVGRRMEDQQRLAQPGDALGKILSGDIGEQGAADANGRPTSVTSISPLLSISSRRSPNRPATCAGSNGAAIVTTARVSAMR